MSTTTLLRRALRANALFSALSGVALLVAAGALTALLGLPSPVYAYVTGAGLLLFAADLVHNAAQPSIDLVRARRAVMMDVAWVAGTALLLLLPGLTFTPLGRLVLLLVAAVVALFAWLQARGLAAAQPPAALPYTFAVSTTIAAPVAAVWATLAEIGAIGRWHPGIRASRLVSDQATGVGAARTCDLGGDNHVDEEVVVWEEERKLTLRVTETSLPLFAAAEIAFTLDAAPGGARVTVSPAYRLRYGVLGRLINGLYVRRAYRRGMATLLAGLKQAVEEAEGVASSPALAAA